MRGLLAGTALAIDRCRGNGFVEARRERGLPADVDGLIANLAHATHEDVIDLGRLEPVPFQEGAKGARSEVDGMNIR